MAKKHNNELLNPTRDVSIEDYMAAKMELDALRKEHGIAPEEKGLSRLISSFFERKENQPKVSVSKKKIIWLTILLGWCGGHRFYSKQYLLAILYLLFCWSGVPMAMAVIDLVIYIPMYPDENGRIMV